MTDHFSENPEQTQESAETIHQPSPDALARIQRLSADLIDELQQQAEGDLVGEIIETAIKLLRDQTNRGDIKLLSKAMKEIRYAMKVFAPYRDTHKVSIFGSARTGPTDPDYIQCAGFARQIVAKGWMVITGAGGGIMAAGHDGAGPEPSFGLAIRLPFEQKANPTIINDDKLINFKYFFTRKLMFVRSSHAVALFPGGFGTFDEGFEVLTLIQTGKSVPLPIVFVDRPGGDYWKGWLEPTIEMLVKRGFVNESDLALFKITDSTEEAIREITHFYENYHSVRTVRDDLVVRLQRPPGEAELAEMNTRFADIVSAGEFRVSAPLPLEYDEPALAHLPRLVFKFNRRDHARLRMLIDFLNDL